MEPTNRITACAILLATMAMAAAATTSDPLPPLPPGFGHALRDHFIMAKGYTNLNQGSYGTVPKAVLAKQDTVRAFVEANPDAFLRTGLYPPSTQYPTGSPLYDGMNQTRFALAKYLGADGEDVVLVENASTGLSVVLRSVPRLLQDRALLYLDIAYICVKEAMAYLGGDVPGAAHGRPAGGPGELLVELNTTSLFQPAVRRNATAFDDALVAMVGRAIDARKGTAAEIALASFSHIVSLPGIVLPIARLVDACHARGVLVLVDGAHAPGQIALDVPSLGADFYVGNGHKWLYSPKGTAFVWVAKERQDMIYPCTLDSGILQGFPGSFTWRGTRDYSAFLSIESALAFRAGVAPGGDAAIVQYLHGLAVRGGRLLAAALGTEMLPAAQTGAMVNVRVPCERATTKDGCGGKLGIGTRLFRKYNFWVPFWGLADQGTWMRLSAQIFIELSDFQMVADAIIADLGLKDVVGVDAAPGDAASPVAIEAAASI